VMMSARAMPVFGWDEEERSAGQFEVPYLISMDCLVCPGPSRVIVPAQNTKVLSSHEDHESLCSRNASFFGQGISIFRRWGRVPATSSTKIDLRCRILGLLTPWVQVYFEIDSGRYI